MGEPADGGREGPRAYGPDPPAIFSPVPHSGPAPRPVRPASAPPRRRPSPRRWTAAAALTLAVIGGAVAARELWFSPPPPGPPPPPAASSAPAPGPPSGLAAALQGAFDAALPEAGMTVRSVRTLPPSEAPGGPLLVTASSPTGEPHVYEMTMTRSADGWNITAHRRTAPLPPVPTAITPARN